MAEHSFTRELELPRAIAEIFAFFADARNLQTLTPPWLRFEILTPEPIQMATGTLIDYRLQLHGIPLRWRSEITLWDPPHQFVDEQVHGPYRIWIHEHTFEERDGVTVIRDDVRYAVLGGALVDRLFVRPDLRKIFEYRHARLREMFS